MGKNLKWATRMLLKLADITEAEIKSIQTDKGVLFLVDADEPDVDVEVFIEDEQGMRTMPEDGDYMVDNYRLSIMNGVITAIVDTTAAGGTEEELKGEGNDSGGEKKRKVTKLNLEASLPEVINTVNDLIEALDELTYVVEEIGGDTDEVPVVEELASVKEKLNKISSVTEKTVATLEKLSSQSNGNFENPNPEGDPANKGKRMSTKDIMDYYTKK